MAPQTENAKKPAGGEVSPPRIFAFSLGFFLNKRLKTQFSALGWTLSFGIPGHKDKVAVWGRKPVSKRGFAIAHWRKASVISFEDGFLRSVFTGREGAAGCSLIEDDLGIYFETDKPNRLQNLILESVNLDTAAVKRARAGIDLLLNNNLSKYNDFALETDSLPNSFVLVIDQTHNDASVAGAGADRISFEVMLRAALQDHPNETILVKTHPETIAGKRAGYLHPEGTSGRIVFFDEKTSPWILFEKAVAVYTVSSQMGFEAILAGHTPVVFGQSFYAGWGLSDDRYPEAKRIAPRSAEQLFHAAYLSYCRWFDSTGKAEVDFEEAAIVLAAKAEIARQNSPPIVCLGMRLWKRGFLKDYLRNSTGTPRFCNDASQAVETAMKIGGTLAIWAGKETVQLTARCEKQGVPILRVEDGFLRSSGLGAELVQPMSLAFDDLGIYYDPTRESRLERLISTSVDLPAAEIERAEKLQRNLVSAGLSKYNLSGTMPELNHMENQQVILVPGQVEDDASILKGTSGVSTNLELLRRTRARFPEAYIVYKPHPDVLAGLRAGEVSASAMRRNADQTVTQTDIAALIGQIDIVSTMTSLTGFEALLRGKEVLCFGAPFYAGWGLTTDLGTVPERRVARPSVAGLVHAALIGYARYWDPLDNSPTTPEVILKRLQDGEFGKGSGRSVRLLAKVQGAFASFTYLWR